MGAILMIVGSAAVVAMAALAAIVTTHFVEWENAAEALTTVAMVTLPIAGAGLVLLSLGRWLYGGWLERSPVVHVSSMVIRLAGFAVTLGLGGMFLFLVFAGIEPDDQDEAAGLGLGAIAGLVMIFAGFLLKPRHGVS